MLLGDPVSGSACSLQAPHISGVSYVWVLVVSCVCAHGAGAVEAMQQSSGEAADCLRQHGATGCTDVTGFGLLGHLAEMTRASQACSRMHTCIAVFGVLACD